MKRDARMLISRIEEKEKEVNVLCTQGLFYESEENLNTAISLDEELEQYILDGRQINMLEKELQRNPTNFSKLEEIQFKIQPIRKMWMETSEWRKRYPMIV